VAIRRIRSTLRVFAKPFDRVAAAELESELKWFAALLGEVRDCQVQCERFGKALNGLPDELISARSGRACATRCSATNALPADGVRRDGFGTVSGSIGAASVANRTAYEYRVRRARTAQALQEGPPQGGPTADRRGPQRRDGAAFGRKAAKRARTQASWPVPCREGPPEGQGYKKIQSVLGDHQDTVVARDMLRRMAAGTSPARSRTDSPTACYMPTSNG
jgi:CHAD domain-containing protein